MEKEQDTKLLSIVVPVYNVEKYLPGCLESIIEAALPETELLLIDDGSTDHSADICKSYAEKFSFIRILHQKNQGPSAARNFGISESRGKYVTFFDADDKIEPEAFQRTAFLLKKYEAQLWISDFYRIAANGCILDKVFQIEESAVPIIEPSYLEHFLSDGERVWNVWRYIFRRDFLLENNLLFIEGVNCAEDLEFIVRALTLAERPAFYHNPYYYYRAHYGDTLTRQYTAKRVMQLMWMLCLSEKHLRPLNTVCSRLLTDKLVKEYFLNIAICCEVPKPERDRAYKAYDETKPLLARASSGILRLMSALLLILNVRLAAWLLYGMKKVKRKIRQAKIRRYGRKAAKKYENRA